MRTPVTLVYGAIVLSIFGSGCGTSANMRTEPDIEFGFVNKIPAQSVYGGVRQDGAIITEAVSLLFVKHGAVDLPLLPALAVVDWPLSAVGDTLTLPITIYAAYTRCQATEEKRDRGSNEGSPAE
jgi:uncharacterized protein YceK